ncbi:helicase-associated domain-containing protein [Microbacterium sp. A204]|uniref:helicase-associated domain-containing protein n=1 Tax=Microbacterium sp. A204 TaxID=3457321 RepID=UPI003FD3A7B5
MSTHARPLAVWLATATDAQLAALFEARGVREDVSWSDFFDAAEALLESASIDRMLPRLPLAQAIALHRSALGEDAGEQTGALVALAILRPDGTPAPTVADAVAAREAPVCTEPADAEPATESSAARAAERAFTSVAAIADLLLLTAETPLALLTDGRLNAGEKRRIAEMGMPAEHLDDLVTIAVDAGLATVDDRRLRMTPAGDAWLRRSASDRWTALTESFRDVLPAGLRTPAGGWLPVPHWEPQYPWDNSWNDRCTAIRTRARLLGLITDDGAEPEWAVPLRSGHPADASGVARMLPTEVDRIFLQNDLSAIAPGPLQPPLDVRLRGIAVRESAAQASSYRFSAESVAHALTGGETAQSILDFLGEISLTGIPQPLEYLVMQSAQRHGLVRVFADPGTGRTKVTSADATLLDAMAVDQSLRPLALSRDADGLSSRVGRDSVYWTLTDARYPAMIVGPEGEPQVIDRHPVPPAQAPRPADYTLLIQRLRDRQGPDDDAAWLDRELDAAVRAKSVLLVEISMPDGTVRELQLEASGLGGGRLRGRDRAADVERTLPVKSIRSARVIDPSAT